MPNLYLVGFMGSGKSTVGPVLAGLMNRPFYDLDELIEQKSGKSILEIFAREGEESFRALETEVLKSSQELNPCVLALGGGTFIRRENRAFISGAGTSVWLKIRLEVARQRCSTISTRPLARDPSRFEALFQFREMFYRNADIHVETEGRSPEQISMEILRRIPPEFF